MEETNFLFCKCSNTLSLTSKQELEPAHAAGHSNCGSSAVLGHGLVVSGNGQPGAQHGLTCPDRRQLGTTGTERFFVSSG